MSRSALVVGLMLSSLMLALPASAADLTGTWVLTVDLGGQGGDATFVFEQEGETLSGTYSGQLGEAEVSGTVQGNEVEFSYEVDAGGQSMKVRYEGALEGDELSGSCTYGSLGEGTFSGKKKAD